MRSLRVLSIAAWLWAFGAGCKAQAPDPARTPRPAAMAVSAEPEVLAELEEDDPAPASRGAAGSHAAAPARPGPEFTFAELGGGVTWTVERGGTFRVFYNGRPGPAYAEVKEVALSRDGRRHAYPARVGDRWRMVVDGKQQAAFEDIEWPRFSPDGAHLLYQAKQGPTWRLVVDGIVGGENPMEFPKHDFGGGSTRVVFIDRLDGQGYGRLVSSSLDFKDQVVVDPRVAGATLSADRTRLAAVVASEGRQRILTVEFDRLDQARRGKAYDEILAPEFARDGVSLAYFATRAGQRLLVVNGQEVPLAPSEDVVGASAVTPGGKGFGALVKTDGSAVTLRQYFVEGGRAEASYDEAEGLSYGQGGQLHWYAARKGERWFVVVNGKEGPAFDRVVSPTLSPDGKHLVYRARALGRRFVVVADTQGKTIREHPACEQVHAVQFTPDGRSVAYAVKDGRRLAWKVEPL